MGKKSKKHKDVYKKPPISLQDLPAALDLSRSTRPSPATSDSRPSQATSDSRPSQATSDSRPSQAISDSRPTQATRPSPATPDGFWLQSPTQTYSHTSLVNPLEHQHQDRDVELLKAPLTQENYKSKFHQLLCREEEEHKKILHERYIPYTHCAIIQYITITITDVE